MNNPEENIATSVVERGGSDAGAAIRVQVASLPIQRKRRRRAVLTVALALLGATAVYRGIAPHSASAAPRRAPSSQAMTPNTEQSVPWHAANADADDGPGQVEPLLVNSP